MAKTHEILSEACSGDSAIRWFRPASGWFTKEIVQIGREFGYRTALASCILMTLLYLWSLSTSGTY